MKKVIIFVSIGMILLNLTSCTNKTTITSNKKNELESLDIIEDDISNINSSLTNNELKDSKYKYIDKVYGESIEFTILDNYEKEREDIKNTFLSRVNDIIRIFKKYDIEGKKGYSGNEDTSPSIYLDIELPNNVSNHIETFAAKTSSYKDDFWYKTSVWITSSTPLDFEYLMDVVKLEETLELCIDYKIPSNFKSGIETVMNDQTGKTKYEYKPIEDSIFDYIDFSTWIQDGLYKYRLVAAYSID